MSRSLPARRVPAVLAAAALGAAALGATAVVVPGAAASADALPAVTPASAGHVLAGAVFPSPPSVARCEKVYGFSCYGPRQLETAYDLPSLYAKGITGRGHTIAIVDSFGSPTIADDLHTFDQAYGLADPNLSIIQPAGAVPPYDPTNDDVVGWAYESTLDVEYAHAMAPEANILLVETPVSETEGNTGLPEMMDAEQYVVQHHLADVISQSFGATEPTFSNPAKDLPRLEYAFKAAAARGVTVLAASGDVGATSETFDGNGVYPYRTNSWPSSDPYVTSVGGTMLSLTQGGKRTAPDAVWNDGYGAGGGGVSTVFARPAYQDSVRSIVGTKRGTPDVSLSAAVKGGAIVYTSFGGESVGFHLTGGTSEATPLFAGIVALAAQKAGHGLGLINPALYALGYGTGLVDVTSGDNSYGGVKGFTAKPGYDLASGLGTVDGAKLVTALAQ